MERERELARQLIKEGRKEYMVVHDEFSSPNPIDITFQSCSSAFEKEEISRKCDRSDFATAG